VAIAAWPQAWHPHAMTRQILFLMLIVFLFGGTTWLIFFILNVLNVMPWPAWVPH
jgi:ABC-type antimicrobial peptide transport system permease subunit